MFYDGLRWFLKRTPIIFILTTKKKYAQELNKLRNAERQKHLIAGKEIGILQVLRFNQQSLSEAKFKESANFFNFEELDRKYPFNPVLEKKHEKAMPSTQGFQGIIEKNESPQVNGYAGETNKK